MKIIILAVIFSFSQIVAQEKALTLNESIEIGLKKSRELKIAKSNLLNAEAKLVETASFMLPALSFNARYSRLSDVDPFQINLPILTAPITIQETYLNNYILSASFEQPIFTGFRLSSLKSAAEINIETENIKLTKETINKIQNIKESFWNFYIAQQIVTLIKDNLNTLKSHLDETEKFLENGLVTKNDFLKIKVELANAELKLIESENNEKISRALFNKSIGFPLDYDIQAIDHEILIDNSLEELNDLLAEAKANRQEIQVTQLQIDALDKQETAAKSEMYPQLYAFGNFYYSNPNQRYMPLEDNFNDSWDVGLSLKWNVWNWGGTSAKVEQVKQSFYQAEQNLQLLMENVELDVYYNFLNVTKAKKKIEISRVKLKSAEENYRITKEKYFQQLATSTDLLDAESTLLNAKTNLVTSNVEYEIGRSSLNKSLGRKEF